jgi:hypothetical protein
LNSKPECKVVRGTPKKERPNKYGGRRKNREHNEELNGYYI